MKFGIGKPAGVILSLISIPLVIGLFTLYRLLFDASHEIKNEALEISTQEEIIIQKMIKYNLLVNSLGYNGFIHNFKNYLLRGEEFYSDRAEENYIKLKGLRVDLEKVFDNQEEVDAINQIYEVVDNYHQRLDVISGMRSQKLSPEEIDRYILINDSPADLSLKVMGDSISADLNRIKRYTDNVQYELDTVIYFLNLGIVVSFSVICIMSMFWVMGRNARKAEKASLKLVEKASQEKKDFFARTNHELRTPMNAVMGFAQIMCMDNTLSDEHKKNLSEIMKASDHLLKIINDLLDLEKIDSGNISFFIEDVSLRQILDECTELMKPIADENMVSIILDGFDKDPCIYVDKFRFKQIMLNLISNGIKYNFYDGWLSISGMMSPDDSGSFRIIVENSGRPITHKEAEKIFKPFVRLEDGSRKAEGTGIGLAIARNLVERMGGRIGVFGSNERHSNSFWVDFPLSKNAIIMDSSTTVQLLDSNLTEQKRNKQYKQILYIEDNPSNILLVKNVLRKIENVQMFDAHDPRLGLRLAATFKPDIILLDLNLPYIDGYEVLDIIRQQDWGIDVKVFAITSQNKTEEIERGLEAGFDRYITKPLNLNQFIEAIEEALIIPKNAIPAGNLNVTQPGLM